MNKANIHQVANAIEDKSIAGLGFHMNYFMSANPGAGCGTVACIAGWCNLINGNDINQSSFYFAQKWLDLSYEEADNLFYANQHPGWATSYSVLEDITAEQAVRTLRHLAETGEIDWTV